MSTTSNRGSEPMSTVMRIPVLWVTCPTCGLGGYGPQFLTRGWDGKTYGFACGHNHHLNPDTGGAKTETRMVARV